MLRAVRRKARAIRWATSERAGYSDLLAIDELVRRLAQAVDAVTTPPLTALQPWFILSTIRTSTAPLSYSAVRSVFSAEERLQQTCASVASIHKTIPGSPIFVLNASEPPPEARSVLQSSGAELITLPKDDLLGRAVASPHKGLGEGMLLLVALSSRAGSANGLWKLSGRYAISGSKPIVDHLDPESLAAHWSSDALSTICFGLGAHRAALLRESLLMEMESLARGEAIEAVMTRIIRQGAWETKAAPPVTGRVAVDGSLIRIG